MNLSETAFLLRQADGFDLRWFTPLVEVDLCGHATLASAHVLWETGELAAEAEARFHTRSGLLTVRQQGAWLEMNFPAEPAPARRGSTPAAASVRRKSNLPRQKSL
jgi:PhzF family phenazine biosynthesis protein